MKFLTGTTEAILNELRAENSSNTSDQIASEVKAIIEKVKNTGDQALFDYTAKFDGVELNELRVPNSDIQIATTKVDPAFLEALKEAKANIESFHNKQKQSAFLDSEKDGVIRGQIIRPLETVGVYVPGGTAAYPSSVLMNVLPAKIAGVKRIVMITPPSENGINPHVLAAANLAASMKFIKLAVRTESLP